MTTHYPRQFPIILLTGTPGTGKSLHALLLSQQHEPPSHLTEGNDDEAGPSSSATPLVHLDIGKLVKDKGFHNGFDEEWQSYEVDEDRLLDYLEEIVNPRDAPAKTGFILDHHDPALFPERWIDLAVVLTCENGVLHERLTARNYPPVKLNENITAEIMETCLSETRESYAPEIIVQLQSNGVGEDVEQNVKRIGDWMTQWVQDRKDGLHDQQDEDGEDA